MIGIYKITNQVNGKKYIGQSLNIGQRWKDHKYIAKSNNENRKYHMAIYEAIRKYGIDNFIFEILEECSKELLDEKERYWISYYNSNTKENGYNETAGGQKTFALSGEKHSQAKLTWEQVHQIKELLRTTDLSLTEIGAKFNITNGIIHNINHGKNWKEENEDYPIRLNPIKSLQGSRSKQSKLDETKVQEMRQEYSNGVALSTLENKYSEMFKVSKRTVRAAVTGESWKHLPIWKNSLQKWI